MRPGILVAIEGIDGAGKSTQLRALQRALLGLGLQVVVTKEPTDGVYGRRIRATAATGRLPPDKELALFLADREEHVRELLIPSLEAGAVVLVDRYYPSTVAYQGSRGLDPRELLQRNEAFAPRPDLTVLLDLPAEVGLSRVRRRDVEENLFERLEDLQRCRIIFNDLELPGLLRLDATQEPEALTQQIVAALLGGPLQARTQVDLRPLAATAAPGDTAWRAEAAQALAGARR